MIGMNRQVCESIVLQGHFDRVIQAIADHGERRKLADMLVESFEVGVQLNIAEKTFQRDAIGFDHANLLLHALDRADAASQPFAFDFFPGGGCKSFQQCIHGVFGRQGAVKIDNENQGGFSM